MVEEEEELEGGGEARVEGAQELSLVGLMEAVSEEDVRGVPRPPEAEDGSVRADHLMPSAIQGEARHAELLQGRSEQVEALAALYAAAHGKQLEHLMRQVRATRDVPPWVILAMARRLMRGTESEQCDVLNAMASTGQDEVVCHICRALMDQAAPRLELAMVSTLGQLGDRRDYQLLSARMERRNLSQELKVALKRALIQIDARHPGDAVAGSEGGLTLSAPAAQGGALTLQEDGGDDGGGPREMSPEQVERALDALFLDSPLEVVALPAPRRNMSSLLKKEEYDWLMLGQGPHELRRSVLFALIVHELVGWPAGLLAILFLLPILLTLAVLLSTQYIYTMPIMIALFWGYVRQRYQHYEQVFRRGEIFLADVSFPEGGERAALALTPYEQGQRPAMRRHVRLSRRLARRYKDEPALRGVVLWDEAQGNMLMLDEYAFLALSERGDIVVRRSSSVMPGLVLSAAMASLAVGILILTFLFKLLF